MNKSTPIFKSALPHIGIIILFYVLTCIYFHPSFQGKVLQQGDVIKYKGMAQELVEYGKPSGWTGSMFSGMPSYQITGNTQSLNAVDWIKNHIINQIPPKEGAAIFILLITSYILLIVLGTNIPTAVLGAIGIAFSSYNLIIIQAGHVTKIWALAYIPLILAGLISIFNKKHLVGLIMFGLGLALQISSNHLQITYYTAIFCSIIILGYIIRYISDKNYKGLSVNIGVLLIAFILGVGSNAASMYVNYEMGKESTRGKSELTPKDNNTKPNPNGGLDKGYAFAWSYGKAETLTLLIPNLMGGESGGYVDNNSHVYKELRNKGAEVGQQIQTYTYWGDQPFTSGPVYFGAIICFLFVFSFFVIPKSYKWWLLGISIFFIFLSWGKHFDAFNNFIFYHLPYYNKFRTVSMALVIPAFIFPISSALALKEIVNGKIQTEKLQKSLIYATAITGGLCLILWLIPGAFFNFQSSLDAQYQMPDWYYSALLSDRKGLLQADAFRSLIFVLLAAVLIFIYIKSKDRAKTGIYIITGLVILTLFDLWQIDKRYLNNENFVLKRTFQDQIFKKSVADNEILKDKSPSYRVLNLNNPFNETNTSYYHKSIGGYHAAKLERYQELIDYRLSKEINSIIQSLSENPTAESFMYALQQCPTLNMLNTKYIIFNPGQPPIENPYHYGNAWFVDSYQLVENADAEMAALETLKPLEKAVIDKRFANHLKDLHISSDSTAKIELLSYAPNKLEYKSSSQKEGLAVFSEIYYPYGWKAFIDGKQVPISRADWILRSIVVPAGEHQIQFVFEPEEVNISGIIATVMSGTLILALLFLTIILIYRKMK